MSSAYKRALLLQKKRLKLILTPQSSLNLLRNATYQYFSTSNSSFSSFLSSMSLRNSVLMGSLCVSAGYLLGRYHEHESNEYNKNRVLPNGHPRTCCDTNTNHLTQVQQELPKVLSYIVGSDNLHKGNTYEYIKGARLGYGEALCIVTPTSFQQVLDCISAAVNANCIIIPQGRNTGLTGGSIPRTEKSNRPTIVINMRHLDAILSVDEGKRVLCFAGAGLATLANKISRDFKHRESHSILGSTFLNPTTAAGVAFGSGGTQVRKGPAYTDRALYVKVVPGADHEGKQGYQLQIVNTLGLEGMEEGNSSDTNDIIKQMDTLKQQLPSSDSKLKLTSSRKSKHGKAKASDTTYAHRLCNHSKRNDGDISRYNADTSGLECNRSEGKVFILATIHDTFPVPSLTKSYWISFKTLELASKFKKQVCLHNHQELPISIEYCNKDAFSVIDNCGRIMSHVIAYFGATSDVVRQLWNVKLFIEAIPISATDTICDLFLYYCNHLFTPILPKPIMNLEKQMNHHVMLTIGDFTEQHGSTLKNFIIRMEQFILQENENHTETQVMLHECHSLKEAQKLNAFRFVAATAFRTHCVGENKQGISVDYALPKNYSNEPPLLTTNNDALVKRMRYSHFGCNVVHEDISFDNSVNVHEIKMDFKKNIELTCHGKLPAEHGHGVEYIAPSLTRKRWMKMDPLNVMNAGVGGLSYNYKYKDEE